MPISRNNSLKPSPAQENSREPARLEATGTIARLVLSLRFCSSRAPPQQKRGGITIASTNSDARDRGKLAASISNAIVGLHRDHNGRGASRARTVMGSDYVICFLEDIYTPLERTLIDAGRFDAVQQTHNAFQAVMRDKFTQAVEQLLDRKVIGFLSQVHIDPDLAVETFILEPAHDGDSLTPAAG